MLHYQTVCCIKLDLNLTEGLSKFLHPSVLISFLTGNKFLFFLVSGDCHSVTFFLWSYRSIIFERLSMRYTIMSTHAYLPILIHFELIIIITRHFRCALMFRWELLTTQLLVCTDVMLTILKLSWTFKAQAHFFRKQSYAINTKKIQLMQIYP